MLSKSRAHILDLLKTYADMAINLTVEENHQVVNHALPMETRKSRMDMEKCVVKLDKLLYTRSYKMLKIQK